MKKNISSHYFYLLISLLSCSSVFSQTLTGTIIDTETKETVAFANVTIGDSYGVITNNEGQFEISVDRFKPTDSLIFSFLGYGRQAVAIKDYQGQSISLVPSMDSLGEVYLIDKNLDPVEILERINDNLKKNHSESFQKWTVFERSKVSNDLKKLNLKVSKADFLNRKVVKAINDELKVSSEQSANSTSNIYLDTYYDLYKNPNHSAKIFLHKGTKLINRERNTSIENIQSKAMSKIASKLETSNTFKVRSGILPVEDSMSIRMMVAHKNDSLDINGKSDLLSEKLENLSFGKNSDFDFIFNYKKYNYTIENAFNYNDEMVYVIRFEPARHNAQYSGELYVSAESFAVLKMNYKLADGKKGNKINLKLLLGIKFEQLEKQVLIIFNKNHDEVYSPKYLKTTTREYPYFDRSLTFVENAPRKERMKLKLNILSEAIVSKEDEILIIDTNHISESQFDNFSQKKKSSLQTISKYNPDIWAQYNIIAPTKGIKDFEY